MVKTYVSQAKFVNIEYLSANPMFIGNGSFEYLMLIDLCALGSVCLKGSVGQASDGLSVSSEKWLFFELNGDLISLKYTFIIQMTSYLARQSHSLSHTSSLSNNRKKIKHFSYNSGDKIGKGFSSIVYRGTNDNTNETVAIKAIDMKGVRDAVSREMLDCQIEALTKLKHPNILKCFDVIRETSHCYIITEYCNEGDLSSILKKKRKMTENEVVDIMKDIVDGFLQIGENKFLHRDLKLANIFMSSGTAKIADFGFAKKSHSSFEKEKYNVGSPLYMSPEALKRNIYSIKNDIWSIGIMIYELLHGQTPWECKTQSELIDKMTRIPVKFKQHVSLSKDIKQFIKKCLEVDQSKRMNLTDLRQWFDKNSEKPRSKTHSVQQKKLQMKPLGEQDKNIKPLGDATNRVSLGEKNRSYSNVCQKDLKSNNSFASKDKENNSGNEEKKKLSKAIIDKNNSILLVEINKFRLHYKIYEKVKTFFADEKALLNSLGSNILKRVQFVSSILLYSDFAKAKSKAQELGMKEVDLYLKQQTNAAIKKYKSVIKEYQKKYTAEIEAEPHSYHNTTELLKKFATYNRFNKELSKQEILMAYWVMEAASLRSDIKKQDLDAIIEAKNMPSKEALMLRLPKE